MKKLFALTLFNLAFLFFAQAKQIEGYVTYPDKHIVKATLLIPFGFFSTEPSYEKLQDGIRYIIGKKKHKLNPEEIKEVSFEINGIQIRMISVYDNLQMSSSWVTAPYKFLKLRIDGYVRVYDYYVTSYSSGSFNPATGMMTGGSSYVYDRFILQRANGELFRPRSLYFKKDMADYFADCMELVDKINSKLLKKSDLEIIVNEYNTGCILNP